METATGKTKSDPPPQGASLAQVWVRMRVWFDSCTPASTFVFSLLLYVTVSFITTASFLGDTTDYADSIVARFQDKHYEFWEFGHVLWRPLGWAITQGIGVFSPEWVKTNAVHYHVILTLIALSWLAGFVTLYFFHRLACFATSDFWLASLSTVGFGTAQAFLNYVQAGTPYIVGLAMLVLAIYAVDVRYDPFRSDYRSVLCGISLALSVLFWFPYVLVVPAIVSMPLVLRREARGSVLAGVSFAIVVGLVYLAVVVTVGLHNCAEILAWARGAAHGIQLGGMARTGFGFARSFINMGNDSVIFKRYLLNDPFSPVSVTDLLRAALAKVVLVYAVLALVIAKLLILKRWRRVLLLLAVATVPVLFLAVRWEGGALERYLPLYPLIFLLIAVSLSLRPPSFQRLVCAGFIAIMAIVNIIALSRHANGVLQETIARRIKGIPASLLNSDGVIYVTHNGDELLNFARSFPWDPLNRQGALRVRAVIEVGHDDLPMWKGTFGGVALTAWARNGNVWVSQRMLSPLPKTDWNWVEHADPRIGWKDLRPFFSRLEYEKCTEDSDGFCLLAPSYGNREFLRSVIRSPTQALGFDGSSKLITAD